jgi:hypothetical protein
MPEDKKRTVLRCNTLEITDPETDEVVVTLTATRQGPGLWMNRPNGDVLNISCLKQEMSICFYSKKHNESHGCPPLALSIDDAGRACVQFKDSETGGLQVVAIEDLAKVIGQ